MKISAAEIMIASEQLQLASDSELEENLPVNFKFNLNLTRRVQTTHWQDSKTINNLKRLGCTG